MHDPGGGGTLREAIAVALGHRVLVEGGTAAAVIDLSNPHPPRKRPRPRPGMPVLAARPSENGRLLLAWCPFCRREHTHGRHGAIEWCGLDCGCVLHGDLHATPRVPCACPAGSGDGHRAAHCRPGSPLLATGYWIQEVTR
jgi:hypothetical protein